MRASLRQSAAAVLLALSAIALAPAAALAQAEHAEHGEAAAHEAHASHGPDKSFYFSTINFAILVGILVWAYNKYAAETFPSRRRALETAMKEAAKAKADAEGKYKEYRDKVANLDREIEALTAQFKRDAEADRDRIVAEAQETARKIAEGAERSAALEVVRARSELRDEAARLAVELAEKLVADKITSEDRDRLVAEYVAGLEA